MKKQILPQGYLEDLDVVSVGMEAPRSYYIPFPQPPQGKVREESPALTFLDGTWQFQMYDCHYDAQNLMPGKYEAAIPVPSCVQYFGCDAPQYSGGRVTFPFQPPLVPRENPIYCYRRSFRYKKKAGKKHYILFEGVDSCFWLYLNGKFVGYSEISHADHEFDITGYLKDGENVLDVAVAKWCKGSYLELQDKWRFSGIFGSVYLLSRPEKHIADYKISSRWDAGWALEVEYLRGDVPMTAQVEGEYRTLQPGEKVLIPVEDPRLWSAEDPQLYTVLLSGGGEYMEEKIALRSVTIENRVVKVNGNPVKFRGANRHEFAPNKGQVQTRADMLRDLELLKQYNFNAVRTSHYPSRPEFYRLCDEYGIYVISEADIECHGAVNIDGGYEEEYFKLLSDNPDWQKQYLARINTMYQREKNRGCILFWSLGNESGYGCNHEESSRWLKARDSRLIHYEGIQCRRDHKTEINDDIYYTDLLDVVSRMYPSVDYMVNKCLEDPREHRPLILCEYAHSMGNSPGGLQDYWDLMNGNDHCCGGFVWEWMDHGIDLGDGKYRYGSDFPVEFSDNNFCIDGCLGPNREIKSATRALKFAMQPVDVQQVGEDLYRIVSRYDHIRAANLAMEAVFKKNGQVIARVPVPVEDLGPHGERTVHLPCPEKIGKNDFVNVLFETCTRQERPLVPAGHPVARNGFTLHAAPMAGEALRSRAKLREEGRKFTVLSGGCSYVFDRFTGRLETACLGGKHLDLGLEPQIIRATLDNDVQNQKIWDRFGLYAARPTALCEHFDSETGTLVIDGAFTSQIYRPTVYYRLRYRFSGEKLQVELEGSVHQDVEFLPRFGMTLRLPESYRRYDYLAWGDDESYCDKKMHTVQDIFSADVPDDFVRYIKPQESTAHWGARWLTVSDGEHRLHVTADREFSFSAVPYTARELMAAAHDWQLPESDKTVVNLDCAMSGVGSESCGPHLDAKYQAKERKFQITFDLDFIENGGIR